MASALATSPWGAKPVAAKFSATMLAQDRSRSTNVADAHAVGRLLTQGPRPPGLPPPAGSAPASPARPPDDTPKAGGGGPARRPRSGRGPRGGRPRSGHR